ncbi:MAG: DUF885 domain-containing protein [Chlamydiota bacterium]|nr:DUF885 domain-containing protein [Chlamydiota bacterium]
MDFHTDSETQEDKKFYALADEILSGIFFRQPVMATEFGDHRFDDRLGEYSLPAIHEYIAYEESALAQLKNDIYTPSLSQDSKVDCLLYQKQMRASLELYKKDRPWETDPTMYISECTEGCYAVYVSTYETESNKFEFLLSRISQIPRVLKEAMKNLKNPSPENTRTAIEITEGAYDFFQHILKAHRRELKSIRHDYDSIFFLARHAFRIYLHFLKRDLFPLSKSGATIGAESFDFILKEIKMIDYSRRELLELGNMVLRQSQEKLEVLARKYGKGLHWKEILFGNHHTHPSFYNLMRAYRQTMERAKAFVQEHDLVTLPEHDRLLLLETPEFDRPIIPLAAYVPSAPMDQTSSAIFFVTKVRFTPFWWRMKMQLREHHYAHINITVVHESYPGHHVQYERASAHPSRLRRFFDDEALSEGWAMYVEEMMMEMGFDESLMTRMHLERYVMLRALRVILDVGLHTKTMNYQEALNLLMNTVGFDESYASSEVHRYLLEPTQPLSYLVGKTEIIKLREACKKKWKDDFSIKKFHDRLLDAGEIPLKVVKKILLQENTDDIL